MINAYVRRLETGSRITQPPPARGSDWGLQHAKKVLPSLRLLIPGLTLDQLKLVGEGHEGIVYRIDEERCVKFSRRKHRQEVASLEQGQGSPFFPRLHYAGKNFMLREYIEGTPLNHYLRRRPLTRELSAQLIALFLELRERGFRRRDMRLSHIIVTPEGRIRIIDPTNLNKDRRDFPRKFWKGMRRRRYADVFIEHMRELEPDLLQRWSKYLLPAGPPNAASSGDGG